MYKRTRIIVEIDVIEPKYLPTAAAVAAFLATMVVAVVVVVAALSQSSTDNDLDEGYIKYHLALKGEGERVMSKKVVTEQT